MRDEEKYKKLKHEIRKLHKACSFMMHSGIQSMYVGIYNVDVFSATYREVIDLLFQSFNQAVLKN